jgi:hypothetical protein
MLAFVLPLLLAQAPAVPVDPGTIVAGLLSALAAKNWIVLVGFAGVGVVYVVRSYALPSWAWAKTDRGGAVVALGTALLLTVATELTLGIVSLATIYDAVIASLVQAGLFNLLKKLLWPADKGGASGTGAQVASGLAAKT